MSLLALRQHFDLNDAHISDPNTIAKQTLLHVVAEDCQYKKLHLLLQTGVDVNAPCWITNSAHSDYFDESYQKSIFTSVSDPIVALMLLFSDGNPRKKVFPWTAKSQVRVWLDGFSKAKEIFTDIFDDCDLESLLASFIFNETYLRNALGM